MNTAPEIRAERTAELQKTLDLAHLAGVAPADRIRVEPLSNRTLDLFDRTLKIVRDTHPDDDAATADESVELRFIPQHADLRARFKFAEVLGSYATLNTLVDQFAPAVELTRTLTLNQEIGRISDAELKLLSDYRDQIEIALRHASAQLETINISEFSDTELDELNEILGEARERFQSLERLLGLRLIFDVERAVERLHETLGKIATVQRSVSGVFLIESEIMFIPAMELERIIADIFKAIGNPFVVDNIDGTVLLAARNLLIQVMSFYAYYGREQIYHILGNDPGRSGRRRVAQRIKDEIHALFQACRKQNKLVLTRVMDNAEREFEISVEAIQNEAANRAIAEVERLLPPKPVVVPAPRPTMMQRFKLWLFGAAT